MAPFRSERGIRRHPQREGGSGSPPPPPEIQHGRRSLVPSAGGEATSRAANSHSRSRAVLPGKSRKFARSRSGPASDGMQAAASPSEVSLWRRPRRKFGYSENAEPVGVCIGREIMRDLEWTSALDSWRCVRPTRGGHCPRATHPRKELPTGCCGGTGRFGPATEPQGESSPRARGRHGRRHSGVCRSRFSAPWVAADSSRPRGGS